MRDMHPTNHADRRARTRRRAVMTALLATTMLTGGVAWQAWAAESGGTPAQASTPAIASAKTPYVAQAGFAPLVEKVRPAVVNIATTEKTEAVDMPQMQQMPQFPSDSPLGQMFQQFFGKMQQQQTGPRHALGSGFIVDADGTIVTNNHVINGATKIVVTLEDGTSYPAKVIGHDAKTDLAVLKIDAKKPLPHVSFGNSDQARVGDWVVAVGNPYGLGGTVTAGIVSANGRDINSGPYDDFIQIDAPINPGNSGGPLFNQQGQVIGIDSAIYSPNGGSVGIGFAIPSNLANPIVAQLREHGHVERGWLGVQMQPLTEPLAKAVGLGSDEGVLVDRVQPDSPAAKAGLKQGDVITAFGGKTIKEPRDLAMAVADTPAGKTAALTMWRDGHERTLTVAIAELKADKMASAADAHEEGPVGLALGALTPANRSQLNLDPSVEGAVVEHVTPDSRAADSGVRPGDVIVKIGNTPVTSPAEAAKRIHLAEREKKGAVPLLIDRDGTTYYLALQLAEG